MSCEPMFDLLASERRQLLGLGHRGEQLLHADLTRRVRGLHVAPRRARNRSAGREHDNRR
jgi:hypothetical protein